MASLKILHSRLNYKLIAHILLAVVIVMLLLWKPWDQVSSTDRTVTVTGTATLRAEPDLFAFSPMYEVKNADKDAGNAAIANKVNEVVAGVKALGVADKDIKNNASAYGQNFYQDENNTYVYNATIEVSVSSKDMAQKVEDYLATTGPTGQITPYGQFSDEKRKELEDEARDQANDDARSKADKSAKSLGYKIGRVKSVEDGAGFSGGPVPMDNIRTMQLDAGAAALRPAIGLQPGQEEITYTVTVAYYVK